MPSNNTNITQPVVAKLKHMAILVRACTADVWTAEWPIAPGLYWFYGIKQSSTLPQEAKLYSVTVRKTANDVWMYLTDGSPLWRAAGAQGVWQPALLPELPRGEKT